MNHIFIDESGDLGNHSNYFVIAAIVTDDPIKFKRLINRTNRIFKKQISKSNEIKGSTTPNNIIKNIFKKLKNVDYDVYVVIFNKNNKSKIRYKDNNELYDIIASELAKIIHIGNSTSIIIDKSKSKNREIIMFNELFENNLNNYMNYPIAFKHVFST